MAFKGQGFFIQWKLRSKWPHDLNLVQFWWVAAERIDPKAESCFKGHQPWNDFFYFFFQILATFKKGYLNVSKKFQTKAKRSLTWPLYGLFGLENPIISNGVYKKLAISNFNQIALVVPKLGAILENSSLYWGSTHSTAKPGYPKAQLLEKSNISWLVTIWRKIDTCWNNIRIWHPKFCIFCMLRLSNMGAKIGCQTAYNTPQPI